MVDIKQTVEAERVEDCALPEGGLVTVEPVPLTKVQVRAVMAALRDPKNMLDVHRVASKANVSWVQVRDIRDAMRARTQVEAAQKLEVEER